MKARRVSKGEVRKRKEKKEEKGEKKR